MRTLKTLAAAAALLMIAGSANAAIILSVVDDPGNPTANLDLQVNIQFSGVGGGGIGGLQFSILTNGAISNEAGASWSSLSWFGNGGGNNNAWGDFVPGPTSGTFSAILKFTLTGATGTVDLHNFLAYDDSFSPIDTNTISTNPYTIVPEPTTAALLGLGLFGLALGGRRR